MPFSGQVPGPYEDTTCQMVAAYGTPSHSHLNIIRSFRDNLLKSFPGGQKTVNLYYRITPFVAESVKRSKTMRVLVILFTVIPALLVSFTSLKIAELFS